MEVASLCDELHCLPAPGGLFDQDPYWTDRLHLYYEVRSKYERAQAESRRKKIEQK
jgi:hypothetical protein